jgi:hypothetical protein
MLEFYLTSFNNSYHHSLRRPDFVGTRQQFYSGFISRSDRKDLCRNAAFAA